jgi:tripartite-type tricarboxylate transporter receptor subunit TctC
MMSGRRFSSAFIAHVFPTREAPIRKQSLCMLFRLFTQTAALVPTAGEHSQIESISCKRSSAWPSKFLGENVMKLPHRRQFLHLAAGAATLPALPRIAWTQSYPTKPVRIVVGYAAGGGIDVSARLMAQWLSERLGQQFIVENRPGAATNIAAGTVVNARPDGYTLLIFVTTNAINTTLYDNLNFNFTRDIAPVASIMHVPLVMVVNPSFPTKTISEFIGYARANPGKVNMAGAGGLDQLVGELFKITTGIGMTYVPYRGLAPALSDLIGGQVHVIFSTVLSAIEYIRAGTLRALAVTTATRFELLPDIPIMSEFLPGFEASQWYGVGAPKNTPSDIIAKLNTEINAALADPKMKARLAELGGTVMSGTPADFGKLITDETEKWGKVIRAANIKPE